MNIRKLAVLLLVTCILLACGNTSSEKHTFLSGEIVTNDARFAGRFQNYCAFWGGQVRSKSIQSVGESRPTYTISCTSSKKEQPE